MRFELKSVLKRTPGVGKLTLRLARVEIRGFRFRFERGRLIRLGIKRGKKGLFWNSFIGGAD